MLASLALTRFVWLSGGYASHDLYPATKLLRFIVRLATLFRAIGSSGDTDGSLKVGEQRLYATSCRTGVCTHAETLKDSLAKLLLNRFTRTKGV